jgi:hypothetical protein
VKIHTGDGAVRDAVLRYPPGSPSSPLTQEQLSYKLGSCIAGLDTDWREWTWLGAADLLRKYLFRAA